MTNLRKYFRLRNYIEKLRWMRLFSNITNSSYGKNLRIHSSSKIIDSEIGDKVGINKNVTIHNSKIGLECKIFDACYLFKAEIGDYSYVNMHTFVLRAKIGKFCSIASHVYIGATPHPIIILPKNQTTG